MVIEIKEKAIWENRLKQLSGSIFLLEWWWGEFQKSSGREVYRLVWEKDGKARAVAKVFFQPFFGQVGYGIAMRCPLYAEYIQIVNSRRKGR